MVSRQWVKFGLTELGNITQTAMPGRAHKGLTLLQKRCAEHYAETGIAAEAARRAGYKCTTDNSYASMAKQALALPHVKAYLEQVLEEQTLSRTEVLRRISDHATASVDIFLSFDEVGKAYIDLDKARRDGKLHLIKKVKQTHNGLEVELVDSQKALSDLLRVYTAAEDPDGPAGPALHDVLRKVGVVINMQVNQYR
jgi:hypothetical protein